MRTEVRTGKNASPRYIRSPERYASQNIASSSQGTYSTLSALLNPDPPYPPLPNPVPFRLIFTPKLSDMGSVTARLSPDCLLSLSVCLRSLWKCTHLCLHNESTSALFNRILLYLRMFEYTLRTMDLIDLIGCMYIW